MSPRLSLFFLIIFGLCNMPARSAAYHPPDEAVDSVRVLHYEIRLDLTSLEKKTLKGYARLQITSKFPRISRLSLDLLRLKVDSVRFEGKLLPYTCNDTGVFMTFPRRLGTEDTVDVEINYHGTPVVEPYGWGGFHFAGTNLAYNLGIALKDNPPNYGRAWFPCIDRFTERASYDFFIRVDDPLKAVCNGVPGEEWHKSDGTTVYHWKLAETIPAYLASVAVSRYIEVKGIYKGLKRNIPTGIFVEASDTAKARLSFIHLNDAMKVFEEHFGAYRWPRVGFTATSLGAMEHATNIAYPAANIDGSLKSETLYAHELSHMWFGDLVTCHSAADMWINEGWASFSEGIFMEGIYGKTSGREFMRKKLHDVLKFASHIDDGSYALAGIPANLTYCTTVYEKGALTVHALRNYLGDDLFFKTVKLYLDSFAFNDISTLQLRDFFSSVSGVDLHDFFESRVFSPGFPHFSLDSVVIGKNGPPYPLSVYVRQKSTETTYISNSNVLEIGFGREDGHIEYDTLMFSGHSGHKTFYLPFKPEWTGADPNEKLADATTDSYHLLTAPATLEFPYSYCRITALRVPSTALVRVTLNWVSPDSLKKNIPGITLSSSRYWTIEGIFPPGFDAGAEFDCSGYAFPGDDVISSTQGSLVLLYRASCADDWHIIDSEQRGPDGQEILFTRTLKKGEYVAGRMKR